MKTKKFSLILLSILIILSFSLSVSGCKKNKNENVNSEQESLNDMINRLNNSSTTTTAENSSKNNTISTENEVNESIDINDLGDIDLSSGNLKVVRTSLDDIDYDDLKYYPSEEAIYTITQLETKTIGDPETLVYVAAKGNISGLSNTYDLILPYSLKWKRGDRAEVSYQIAFDEETDKIIIIDLTYIKKVDYDVVQKRREEKAKEEETLEETSSENESVAESTDNKKVVETTVNNEEAKKKAEEESKRKAEEDAKIAAAKAQAESLAAQNAELARLNQALGQ